MRKMFSFLLLCLLSAQVLFLPVVAAPQDAAKSIQPSPASVTPLRNQDLMEMVKATVVPEVIIAKINSSACDFDTT
ncbi:MAG: hypothetical protein ACRD68_08970, partial [Pyrinomonadaceae bacterium]